MTKLKPQPCPVCGSKPKVRESRRCKSWWVACTTMSYDTYLNECLEGPSRSTRKEAIEIWNRIRVVKEKP